jgi:hypothetical protein
MIQIEEKNNKQMKLTYLSRAEKAKDIDKIQASSEGNNEQIRKDGR